MASLLGFSQCPQCAKRGNDRKADNLAEYSDGYHCFSCGYHKTKRNLSTLNALKPVRGYTGITLQNKLPTSALKWLAAYNLTIDEIAQFKYVSERVIKNETMGCNLLCLIHTPNYWLCRNLDDSNQRYLSSGVKPLLKYGNNDDILIFVEDVISAIKVGRVATCAPMLGAKVMQDWWEVAKKYNRVIIWGDNDKAIDNVKQARRASEIINKKVEYIISKKDPKYYSTLEIKEFIYGY